MAIISTARFLFLVDFIELNEEDYQNNALAITWYEKIQPIYLSTDVHLLGSKEMWIRKLKTKSKTTLENLNEFNLKLGEFKSKDRFSEAESCVDELMKMSKKIQEFKKLVSISFFQRVSIE